MTSSPPLIVGLTGGIGSGKSTVSALLNAHDIPVIDADQIAREVVAPGSEGLKRVIASFGEAYLLGNGELDRAKLRETVFRHAAEKRTLERLLHPLIENRLRQQIAYYQDPSRQTANKLVVLAIPLLIEKLEQGDRPDYIDEIWVVDCAPELQLQRAMRRDAVPPAQIQAIIDQQASREARLHWADRVIENNAGEAELKQQVEQLLQQLNITQA